MHNFCQNFKVDTLLRKHLSFRFITSITEYNPNPVGIITSAYCLSGYLKLRWVHTTLWINQHLKIPNTADALFKLRIIMEISHFLESSHNLGITLVRDWVPMFKMCRHLSAKNAPCITENICICLLRMFSCSASFCTRSRYLRERRPRPNPARRRQSLCRWKRKPGSSRRGSAPSSAPGTSPLRCWGSGTDWTGPSHRWWCLSAPEGDDEFRWGGELLSQLSQLLGFPSPSFYAHFWVGWWKSKNLITRSSESFYAGSRWFMTSVKK